MYIQDEGRLVYPIKAETREIGGENISVVNNRIVFNNYSARKKGYVSTFVNVSFLGWQAEWLVQRVLKYDKEKEGKGALIHVSGLLVEDEYDSKKEPGKKEKALYLEVDGLRYAKSKNNNQKTTQNNANNQSNTATQTAPAATQTAETQELFGDMGDIFQTQ